MPRGGRREGAGRKKKVIGSALKSTPKLRRDPVAGADKPRTLASAIRRAKDLTVRLLDELDAVTTHIGELEDLIIDETAEDKDARRRNAMLRAIELGARSATLKALLAATRAWAELERGARTPASPGAPKPSGKKQLAQAAAETAGQGTEWGDDLDPASVSVN